MRARVIPGLTASILVLAVVAATVVAAPAQAIPGLVYMSDMSTANSSTTKTLTVDCPAGTTVIGGGGHVSTFGGEVFLTGLEPVVSMSGTAYRVAATEDETGYAGSWRLFGYAICAPAPLGLEYQTETSTPNSNSSQGVAATCSRGKYVIGAGAVINGGGRNVGLSHSLPTPNPPTAVAAVAHEGENGYGGTWSVTSHAVCADPLPGLRWVVGDPQAPAISAEAWCPAGTQVHGVGGYLNGGWGEVRLTGIYPWLLAGAFAVGGEDETGFAGSWAPVAVALCAT
jgi:hypothetical protein